MITNIKLAKVATYIDSVEINDLKAINFIYGSNGTGKTTLSNYLYDSSDLKFNNCSKNWQNNTELETLVYNKKFREEYFGKNKLIGVFSLGKATKEEIETINFKKEELKNFKEQFVKRNDSIRISKELQSDKTTKFKEKIWKTVFQKNKILFKEAFTGSMRSKDSFYKKIIEEYKNNKVELLDFEVIKNKANTIFGEAPKPINLFSIIDSNLLSEIEENEIWQKKIIGKADVEIAKLIQRLNINDWVIRGKNYIQETGSTCPFCQEETINDSFKKQLDEFFDEIFTDSLKRIKTLQDEYLRTATTIVNQLNQIESEEKENVDTKIDINIFSAHLKTLISELTVNKEVLNNKNSEPSRSINLQSTHDHLGLLNTILTTANTSIEKHNKIVLDYTNNKAKLIKSIWKYLIEENQVDVKNYIKELEESDKRISGIQTQYNDFKEKYRLLDIEINNLSSNVTSSEGAVIQINNILKLYGFNSFSIVQSKKEDNHYEIQREDGSLAEATLSEGEITFITFLYFLQIAKNSLVEGKISRDKVLVIDDPISSLDSNVLYVVSTLIKEIIKEVRSGQGSVLQVILLTHNVFFHKEVSFIDGRNSERKNTNYWILRKRSKVTSIQAFGQENPIHSSYELLWSELKTEKSLVSIQNTMRRIIENYFRLLGKYRDDKLIDKFENKEEKDICRALISWINDGSHSINDDLFIEYQDQTTENYKSVFKAIFEKTNHIEHYKMMMQEED